MISTRIKTIQPQEKDLDNIIKEWWDELDESLGETENGPIPDVGVPSSDGNYVFIYGHYEGKGPASATHRGKVKDEHLNRTIVAPLVNGRYGIGESYIGNDISEISRNFGEAKIGLLQSQYTDNLFANVNRGTELIDIPQFDWVSHENPRSHELEKSAITTGYYFGMWVFIEPGQLSRGDILNFGGKGGPFLGNPELKNPSIRASDFISQRYSTLERFITKAAWTIGGS